MPALRSSRALSTVAILALLAAALTPSIVAARGSSPGNTSPDLAAPGSSGPVLFFAADGMRQDIVERYGQALPGFADL
ncbi:MAG TPA: hypothetical protein VF119_09705, partial [Candidatus Limnocylindrales bacterium]